MTARIHPAFPASLAPRLPSLPRLRNVMLALSLAVLPSATAAACCLGCSKPSPPQETIVSVCDTALYPNNPCPHS